MEKISGAILEEEAKEVEEVSLEYILLTFKVKGDMDPVSMTVTSDQLIRHIVLTIIGQEAVNEA